MERDRGRRKKLRRNRHELTLLRIAARLGFVSVAGLEAALTREEIIRWCAVAEMDGWGEEQERHAETLAELHNALTLHVIRSGHRVEHADIKTKFDFLPRWPWGPKRPKKQAADIMPPDAMAEAMKRRLGL